MAHELELQIVSFYWLLATPIDRTYTVEPRLTNTPQWRTLAI